MNFKNKQEFSIKFHGVAGLYCILMSTLKQTLVSPFVLHVELNRPQKLNSISLE
jgi:hypothetical protein